MSFARLCAAAVVAAAFASPCPSARASTHDPAVVPLGPRVQADAAPDAASAIQALAQTHLSARGASLSIETDPHTGLIRVLTGHFPTTARGGDPGAVAAAFLSQHRAAFGLSGANVSLRMLGASVDELGMGHARVGLEIGGIPVEGSQLLVHTVGAAVRAVNGGVSDTRLAVLRRQVSAPDAAQLAVDDLEAHLAALPDIEPWDAERYRSLRPTSVRLVWLDPHLFTGEEGQLTPAWSMDLAEWRYFISAVDGSVLAAWDGRMTALDRLVYTAFNTTDLPGSLVLAEGVGDPAVETTDIDVIDAFILGEWAFDYYSAHHGRDSWDDHGADIISTVRYSEGMVNAFWNGYQLVYGDGDKLVQDDVTLHELTHGVIQETAGLIYAWQPGALNEAIADMMAYWATSDALIGEGLDVGPLRDLAHPQAHGQPEDMGGFHYLPRAVDNGGVHTYSSIPAHAAWLMTDGGEKDGYVIDGQGSEVIEEIWYRALTLYMYPATNFSGARAAVELSCRDLRGGGSDVCEAVEAAFDAQGIL